MTGRAAVVDGARGCVAQRVFGSILGGRGRHSARVGRGAVLALEEVDAGAESGELLLQLRLLGTVGPRQGDGGAMRRAVGTGGGLAGRVVGSCQGRDQGSDARIGCGCVHRWGEGGRARRVLGVHRGWESSVGC